jgi:hypothetical protein
VSVDTLGQAIGLGRTAEVYAWKAGYILKLFHPRVPLRAIEHEWDGYSIWLVSGFIGYISSATSNSALETRRSLPRGGLSMPRRG